MKSYFNILIIAVVALTITSCGKDEGGLDLSFNLTYEDEPLVMFEDYSYPTGENFSLSRVSFYISNLSLDDELLKDVDYIDLTESHSTRAGSTDGYSYAFDNLPVGDYNDLLLSMGVNAVDNAKNPADFESTSALSRSGEYWNAWESYVFYKIEGMMDSNGDGTKDKGISLHIGGDDVFRTISFPKPISIDGDARATAKITIDLAKVFNNNNKVYDMQNFSGLHSKDAHSDYMIELMDNTIQTMTIQ